jgi:hypothetical protein
MWENKGKVEKWEFVKSHDFIRYFILKLKYCHMIMTWHQSSHTSTTTTTTTMPPPPSLLTSLPPPLCEQQWQQQMQWPQYPATPPVGPHMNCVTHHMAQMTFIVVWATDKFFFSLLSLFYGLTSCFYLSFRLTTTFQPRNSMLYAQPPTPPFPTTVGPCEQGGRWSGNWTTTPCRGDVRRPMQWGTHKVYTPAPYTHHLVLTAYQAWQGQTTKHAPPCSEQPPTLPMAAPPLRATACRVGTWGRLGGGGQLRRTGDHPPPPV